MRKRLLGGLGACALLLGALACDDETSSNNTTTSSSSTTGTGGEGAGGSSGTGGEGATGGGGGSGGAAGQGGSGGAGGGGGSCDHDGLVPVDDRAASFGAAGQLDDVLVYNGYTVAEGNGGHELGVELWFKYGASTVPHSFVFSGENYSTCHTCVLIHADCVAGECPRKFLVQEGTLNVTTLSVPNGTIAGTIENATAIEVTIGSSAVSTPVPNGETWCLESVSFSAPITEHSVTGPTKP